MDFDFDKFDDKKTEKKDDINELEPPKIYSAGSEKAETVNSAESKNDKASSAEKSAKKSKKKSVKGKEKKKSGDTVTVSFTVKKLNKKQIAAIIAAAVFIIIVLPTAIYCGVNGESPADMIADIFTPNDQQIIGKWQTDDATAAYQFYDDGTYKSYNSLGGTSYALDGTYEVKGSTLTLSSDSSSTYKISINGDSLSMRLETVDGIEESEKQKDYVYKKTQNINIASLYDSLVKAAESKSDGYINSDAPLAKTVSDLDSYYSADSDSRKKIENDGKITFADDNTPVYFDDEDKGDNYTKITVKDDDGNKDEYYVKNDNINENN